MIRMLVGRIVGERMHVIFTSHQRSISSKRVMLGHGRFLFSRFSIRLGVLVQPSKGRKMCMLRKLTTISSSNAKPVDLDKQLLNAMIYEAESGYIDVQGKTMRFSDFLYSRLLLIWPSLSCKLLKVSIEEVRSYTQLNKSDRSKLLDKVCPLFGFSSANHMLDHVRALRDSAIGLPSGCIEDSLEYDASVLKEDFDALDSEVKDASRRFPCLILGSSQQVDLYCATDNNIGFAAHVPLVSMEGEDNYSGSKDLVTGTAEDEIKESITAMPELNTDIEESCTDDVEKQLRKCKVKGMKKSPAACFLDVPIKNVQGVTSKQWKLLEENGFFTVRKLLCHFPRTYINVQDAYGELEDGQFLSFTGSILSSRGYSAGRSFAVLEVIVACLLPVGMTNSSNSEGSMCQNKERNIYLHLKKFTSGKSYRNYWVIKNLQSKYQIGHRVSVCGKIKALEADDHFGMSDYSIEVINKEKTVDSEVETHCNDEKIQAIYSAKGDCEPKFIGKSIKRILPLLPPDLDPLPDEICSKFNLMNLGQAYHAIHCPNDLKQADWARRRFIFDEFFYLQMGLLFQRYEAVNSYLAYNALPKNTTGFEHGSVGMEKWSELTLNAMKSLPFSLTNAQLKVASEIIWDLRRPIPMSRLLVGEVGCGKTVVAYLAAVEVISYGFQVAFMVPTEILATQHYQTVLSLVNEMECTARPSVALLTGSTTLSRARAIRLGLESGDISLVIGTHSLISESVNFKSLCLAIIDEQQRFGVLQKGKFSSKACTTLCPIGRKKIEEEFKAGNEVFFAQHVLVMTATPIPRTLALALYGDMSLSQIDEFPRGRKPVKTVVLKKDQAGVNKAYKMVKSCLNDGGRAFIVYPLIEESEHFPELDAAKPQFEKLSAVFEGYSCGLLHGKMKSSEKESAIQAFREGNTQVLIATQVIEVGIDIPEATMIVVMDAERYGISQLHQLRGRIGRGYRDSTCLLLSASANALKRLKLLEHTSNGFKLAEADLRLRGPGQLLGTQQSGYLPEFSVARLETDGKILEQARIAAIKVLKKYQGLDSLPALKAELSMRFPGFSPGV